MLKQQCQIAKCGTSDIFTGETHLHLGDKHTFGDIADAILDQLSKVEAECLMSTLKLQMTQPRFLKQHEELEEFIRKFKANKVAN